MSNDAILRLNAALEGRYRIERELGEGGMATVYLADDLKHERKVALKLLKPELAAVVGAERFLAEIKTTANLQHPHILPLFDSGQADGFLFYVMPYVAGESLRDRLDREHQLPVDEAVQIAKNVAEALDYAHRQGVIHRDIKPANVLMLDGKPVVSDFGIALAVGAAGGGRITETGLSLGTPHYMSPEQATGDTNVGPATDVYALGCVLYEMLVGEPPYTGSTPQAILGKIITGTPTSVRAHRKSVPPHVEAVIAKGLEKVPADRFAGAQDFVKALADSSFGRGAAATNATSGLHGPWNRTTTTMAALAAVFAGVAGWSLLAPESASESSPVRRFVLEVPGGAPVGFNIAEPLAFTPDGESVIVNVNPIGAPPQQLFMRPLGSLEMIPIRGTETVGSFFVSPDGEWLGVHDNRNERMVRIPVSGGPSATVAPTPGSSNEWRGASWGDRGVIVYAAASYFGLMSVPAVGGEATALTVPGDGELHQYPRMLPGSETVLFELVQDGEPTQIAALSVASGEYDVLTQGTSPDHAPGGYLVFRRDNALWAASFDADRRELTTDPVPVVEGVRPDAKYFALSGDGALVYAEDDRGDTEAGVQLVTVDLEGNQETLVLGPRPIQSVSWSRDGESIVYSSIGQIYAYDVTLGTTPRQLTFEGNNINPVFSPDGTRVAFSSIRDGTDGADVFVKDLGTDAPAQSVITLEATQLVTQWPSDSLIVFERGAGNVRDLWTVDLSNPEDPRATSYLASEADLRYMVVSPDGTLAAYRSSESGQSEIYVRSFPVPGGPTIVSEGGGSTPFWSPDGGSLYYSTGPNTPWMVARLQTGPVPAVLSREELMPPMALGIRPFQGAGLHPDGDRFILGVFPGQSTAGEPTADRLILVENFVEELKRLVPN